MTRRNSLLLIGSLAAVTSFAQNNALDFDGVDDNVLVPGASDLIANAPGITLACWVYPTNAAPAYPDFDGFAGFRNEADCDFYLLQISPANTIEGRLRNSNGAAFTVTSTSLQLNTWQHLALVFDGATLKMYRNGTVVGSVAASGQITNGAVDLFIGDVLFQFTHFYLDGRMDNTVLFSRALPAAEVECLAYGEIADTSGLQLSYNFDQGVADGNNAGILTLTDGVGGNDGTLGGFTLDGTLSNFVNGYVEGITQDITICQGESIVIDGQTIDTPGTYTGTVTSSLGCTSTNTVNLYVTPVEVGVTPLNINLFSNATNAALQWLDCDDGFAPIPGATASQFTPTADGNYAVQVIQFGCTDTSACYTVVGVGIGENGPSGTTLVYEAIRDRLVVSTRSTALLTVSDAAGRVVMERRIGPAAAPASTAHLANGRYIAVLTGGDERQSVQFVLAR